MNSTPSRNPLSRTQGANVASASSAATPISVWILRIVLVGIPLAVGAAVSEALADRTTALRFVAVALIWIAWAVLVIAAFVPRPAGLTAFRIGGPGFAVAAVVAAFSGASVPVATVALVLTLTATVIALLPVTIDHFVDGASYGDERRYALRTPLPVVAGPLPLAVAVACVGVLAGPLLLADQRWLPGAIAICLGWPTAAVLIRSIHGLATRWLVFVPAGMTIVDNSSLATPVHLPRGAISRLGPALVDTDAVDLTNNATGLVLEATLDPEIKIETRNGRSATDGTSAHALLISPLRPGAVLDEARGRRIAVG